MKGTDKTMHEMSIAQGIIDIVRQEMKRYDASVLKSVRLSVGAMSAVVPEALSFCFNVIVSGTELEGAKLIYDAVPLIGLCELCSRQFEIENFLFECPYCKATKIKTVSGRELTIVEMEIE